MYKKIILVLILFSMSLIAKEKTFLDYLFLKEISERIDKACGLKANGKTVKAEKALKEIDQEMKIYFSKLGNFYLKKECSLALSSNNYSGSLECLHNISIGWGGNISKKVLEQIEDSKNDIDEIVFINGEFKLNTDFYSGFKDCPTLATIQEIHILASPISIKVSKKEWSDSFSEMSWDDANAKCFSIKMRLPSIDELRFAPRLKWGKDAQRKSEKESGNENIDESLISDMDLTTYWSSKELGDKAYWVTGFGPGAFGDEVGKELKAGAMNVRCIR